MKKNTPTSDPIYKRIYAFAEMVADLLRSVVPEATLEALDLRTLEEGVGRLRRRPLPAAPRRHRVARPRGRPRQRLGLRVGAAGVPSKQRRDDGPSGERVHRDALPRTAARERSPQPGCARGLPLAWKNKPGQLPLVLPVVLYNGESRWTAADNMRDLIVSTGPADAVLDAFQPSQRYLRLDLRHAEADYAGELTTGVARLEQIRTPDDLDEVIEHFAAALGDPEQEELWRAFRDWLFAIHKRMKGVDDPGPPPPGLTLKDLRKMTLEERVAQWPEQWKREGIELGKQQGIVQGRRDQLRRQAEVRFGVPTAQRLFASLQREDDPQRLDEIAVAVVRCETADELLRQASHPTPDS